MHFSFLLLPFMGMEGNDIEDDADADIYFLGTIVPDSCGGSSQQ